jgi:tetratricopeptide (TPR) repeat protein
VRPARRSFDPEDAWHWWIRALALLELDRIDEAIEAARSGLAVEPESPMLLGVLARCHIERDDLAAAEEAALGALRLDAEDADHLALYALIVAKAGQLEKARKLVARARSVDPENVSALRIEAAPALVRGNDRKALQRSKDLRGFGRTPLERLRLSEKHRYRLHGAREIHQSRRCAAGQNRYRAAVAYRIDERPNGVRGAGIAAHGSRVWLTPNSDHCSRRQPLLHHRRCYDLACGCGG